MIERTGYLQFSMIVRDLERSGVHGPLPNRPLSLSHMNRICNYPSATAREASDRLKSFSKITTHSSVLAWRIPGTGEPGGLPSMEVAQSWTRLKRLSSSSRIEGMI